MRGTTVGWGGAKVGVSSTSKNRPSLHKYKTLKQFELKVSKSTQCPLSATCLSRF